MEKKETYYKVVDFDKARKSGIIPAYDRPKSRNNTGFVKTIT
jgi:hypothetical protein